MRRGLVHVVDDDDSIRTALLRLLTTAGYEARGYASAGEFLIEGSVDAPACVLLDVRMPGPSGLDLQRALAERAPTAAVVFLSAHGDLATGVSAMKSGAVDFLSKPVDKDTLLQAIDSALGRSRALQQRQLASTEERHQFSMLSPREREVLALIVAGKLNKQIADALQISERTVKAHRASVMDKLQVRSLAELVQKAARIVA